MLYFVMPIFGPYHVRWAPCHYSMALPQVVDEGSSHHLMRLDANICTVNKQMRIAEKE
jgi:hypothetical protein